MEESMYSTVMRDAVDYVLITAVRQAIDTRNLNVEFDANLGPGPHPLHTLTISLRNEPTLAVSASGISHEWLPVSTGFIDVQFSRLVAGLLAELIRRVQDAGRFL